MKLLCVGVKNGCENWSAVGCIYDVGTVYPIHAIRQKIGNDEIVTIDNWGNSYFTTDPEVHEHFILLPDNYTDKDIFIEYLKHGITV